MAFANTPTAADLYGVGWAFPPRFARHQEGMAVDMAGGTEVVRRSMRILFMTQPGERIMRSDYGCDLQSSMFANISEDLLAGLRSQIGESLLRHEPRVALESVTVDEGEPNHLRVAVVYRLAGSTGAQRVIGSLDIADGRGGSFG